MAKWLMEGEGKDQDVVISSRLRLARNLENHRFSHSASEEELANIADEIASAMDLCENSPFSHFLTKDVDRIDRRVLVERHLISPDLIKNKNISEYYLREDENMTIMVNEEDHLRIQALFPGNQLDKALEAVQTVDKKLQEKLNYAWHMEFGYLTACPTNTGTGLRASVMVHLPALKYTKQLKGIFDSLGKLGIAVRGIYGEGSEALGDLFQISNQKTLGLSEIETIENLKKIIDTLIFEERTSRKNLLEHTPAMVLDGIYRSLGILLYARVISAKEALQHLSHIRVGACEGLFPGAEIKKLDNLMLHVQKYNMMDYKRKIGDIETENEIRAKFIHEFLKEEAVYG